MSLLAARFGGWPLRLAWALSLVLVQAPSFGQAPPQIETRISSRQVEVEQPFEVTLSIFSEQDLGSPAQPTLPVPKGLVAQGPRIGTNQQMSISGGRILRRQGFTATWTVVAQTPGSYRIGPPSLVLQGRRVSGKVAQITVVQTGQGPRSRRRFPDPFDPFDLLKGPRSGFRGLFDDLLDDATPDDLIDNLPPYPEHLRLEQAPDNIAFLRATVTPKRAVVGEQVTLNVYAYGGRGPFRTTSLSPPAHADFLSFPIEDPDGERPYRVPVGEEIFNVQKVLEVALFPIKAGELEIGGVEVTLEGRNYPSQGRHVGLPRQSKPLKIQVTEPPLEGRPPGYRIGDVGKYSLSAVVEPRQVRAGEPISVVVKLTGTGNLPFSLSVPQSKTVEWLEPTIGGEVEPQGSVVQGWRKFTYIVRLHEAGDIDLGQIELPYFDPRTHRYRVARAALGRVKVEKNPNASDQPKAKKQDPFDELLSPRLSLGAGPRKSLGIAGDPWFWWSLLFAPLSVLLAGGGVQLMRGVRNRLSTYRSALSTHQAKSLKEARLAAAQGHAEQTALAVERALFQGIEAKLGLKARGVLRGELSQTLELYGVKPPLSDDITELLNSCENIRFAGSPASPDELAARAEQLCSKLGKLKTRPKAN